ncbi:hypothetical protein KDD17_09230 [Sulfitobacter albidus]|uniref:Pilus assembly protein n=2 Tax=Sulfitobacter albidus TaxID=2829501 RepID=A0A975JGA5_9RHOB|nr:hypothetical protein KDD17_09230 [Sulfitobacter albidus]
MINLKSFLNLDFARDEEGSIALETMIIIPVLFWVYMAMFSIFDAYRQYALHQKAAYTIGDMVSRETAAIDNDYLDGMHALFDTMTRDPQDSTLRVSLVYYDAGSNTIKLDWSQTRGTLMPQLSEDDVTNIKGQLPNMVDAERVLLVETWANYEPPFKTGLERRVIDNFVFTRPRYAPQIVFDNAV